MVQPAGTWVLSEHLTPLENQSLDELYRLTEILEKKGGFPLKMDFQGQLKDMMFKIIALK